MAGAHGGVCSALLLKFEVIELVAQTEKMEKEIEEEKAKEVLKEKNRDKELRENNQKMKDQLFITKDNLSSIYLSRNENEKALPLVEEAYEECVRINNEKDKGKVALVLTKKRYAGPYDNEKVA